MLRWIPEHFIQINTPSLAEVQRGAVKDEQVKGVKISFVEENIGI